MRKSAWAAAGFGTLVLLLSACGGSGSSTPAASSTSQNTSASQSTSASASSSSASASATGSSNSNRATTQPTPTPHNTAGPQPSSGTGNESIPAVGTMILTIRNTPLGQIIVEASGYVVYTYAKDPKNGTPTCTGSCNTTWAPVIGVPQVTQGVTIPGTFAVVTTPSGKKQVTYNGKPLYTYKSAGPLVTTGNGIGGVWYVVKA
jgi:predicted lipoprotein with Yx(FWY)xxD motif